MLSVDVLIEALVDEDRRLRGIARDCPAEFRDISAPGDGLGLKETLAHLTCWDEFTVEYFDSICRGGARIPSFSEFVASSHDLMRDICSAPFQDVLEKYRAATRSLIDLLRVHWETMTDEQHNNLFLPLRHRRHHRRLLADFLDGLSPSVKEEGLADAAG